MKNIKKKKAVDTLRSRLQRSARAASNMKFACEFALECMDLREQAESPGLIAEFDKSIEEVLSAVDQESKARGVNGRSLNQLDVLGAILLRQLDPTYTLLARVRSFKVFDLLTM